MRNTPRRMASVISTTVLSHSSFSQLCSFGVAAAFSFALACPSLIAQQHDKASETAVRGVVHDPLGSLVVNARVDLWNGTQSFSSTTTGPDGSFSLPKPNARHYVIRVTAPSFETTLQPVEDGDALPAEFDITVATKTLTQQVTVTATGTPLPEAQTGASITVLPSDQFRYMNELQGPLRLVPGVQVTQTGEVGGTSGLSIRGADTDASKVLIDGVPANAIGGGVEFANLANVGIQSMEVLREPNSALYGSDALAGVVSLTSARASTPLPLVTYSGDAGNFGTYRNEGTAGTVYRQFDLYSAFARMDTDNNLPGSEFHNATYAGNFGWTPTPANDLRFTARHIIVSGGQPNAIALYGIPDNAKQKEQDNYYNAVWNNQATSKWHNQIRYGGLRQNGQFISFGTAGIVDPNTGYLDGLPVTLKGANGYTVTGTALFPDSASPSEYLETSSRDFVYAQTDYRFTTHLLALGAFKYEDERGANGYSGAPVPGIERGNYSYTIQLAGDLRNRLFYNLGTGLEDNGLFGFAGTPRASFAYYLFLPSNNFWGGTKLHGSFGKGIKEPSVYQQQNSLYGTLLAQPNGPALISKYNVAPVGPEDSRTFDGGVEQQLVHSRARIGLTWFHDEFTNRLEYVPQQALLQLGVSVASLTPFNYGAYLNSSAFRSQGLEVETEVKLNSHVFARGGYTYTDAVVQRSFSSDNLYPSFNTSFNFSDIPIGAFSPLVGARPFRVAPHTGYFALNYTQSKLYASLTGTLVSRRDDSDFLSDSNFGNSLLLPNRNLLGSYQRVELGGGYQITPWLSAYTNLQNALSQHYQEAFGYPALPFTFRTGLKLRFGGESWKLK